MKDKKFVVMCVLLAVWIALFIGMVTGEFKVHPRVEYLITFLCIGWFAYWTLSSVREYVREQKTNVSQTDPTTKPTEKVNQNGRTKKASKAV